MLIRAQKIIKKYNNQDVLKGVSVDIKEGEVVSIYGPSGSGKTTLLNILSLLDAPTSGTVDYYANGNIEGKNFNRVDTVGYIFQFHHLLSEFKIIDNLIIPQLLARNNYNKSKLRAKELLSLVGLYDLRNRYPYELSGGERQRVAVIRGVVNYPRVVFADEPTGNLDDDNSIIIVKLLNDLRKDFGISFVIATHDKQITKISDRSLYLLGGNLNNRELAR